MVAAPMTLLMPGAGPPPTRIASLLVTADNGSASALTDTTVGGCAGPVRLERSPAGRLWQNDRHAPPPHRRAHAQSPAPAAPARRTCVDPQLHARHAGLLHRRPAAARALRQPEGRGGQSGAEPAAPGRASRRRGAGGGGAGRPQVLQRPGRVTRTVGGRGRRVPAHHRRSGQPPDVHPLHRGHPGRRVLDDPPGAARRLHAGGGARGSAQGRPRPDAPPRAVRAPVHRQPQAGRRAAAGTTADARPPRRCSRSRSSRSATARPWRCAA